MIQKYVDKPKAISSRPALSTENYDVYLLSCLEPCEIETHDDYSDTYFACEQGGEFGFPVCTVYVERRKPRMDVFSIKSSILLSIQRSVPSALTIHSYACWRKQDQKAFGTASWPSSSQASKNLQGPWPSTT